MKRKVLSLLVFALTFSSVIAQVNITFELNTATIASIDASGIFLAGGTGFGVPGDNQLTDVDEDGTYSITIQKSVGFSSNYTFLNGNCPGWDCKENLTGLPCSDPENYNDRYLPPVMSDTIIKACFGTCDDDGSCTLITDSIDITFQLNTSSITVDAGGIFIAGGGNFGNPGDNPMVDPEGDGVYTFSSRRAKGFTSYYTFTNGNCGDYSCKEDLKGLPCGDSTAYYDRFLKATLSDTTILVCFGTCTTDGTCETAGVSNWTIDKDLFSIRPTVVHNYITIVFGKIAINFEKEMTVMNSVGQIIQTLNFKNETTARITASAYPSGIYYMTTKTDKSILTKKFVVQK